MLTKNVVVGSGITVVMDLYIMEDQHYSLPEDKRKLDFFTGKRSSNRFLLEKLDSFSEKDLSFMAKVIGKRG